MVVSLLQTKLFFPQARFSLVARPRLVQKLKLGLQKPLTLISAPVGYGKTTLLSEWHADVENNLPSAWLSLDPGDNELARFLFYLKAALETIDTGSASNTTSLLNSAQLPSLEAIITALINDLNGFGKELVLVLDDYQMITNPQVHDALNFLLDHCPPQLHLVLLTRVDPPLPLARLRVRNELVEIRAADLRFTVNEIKAFFARSMELDLPITDISMLEARTEGWIAGLQLAGLSFKDHDDLSVQVAKFTGSHHFVVDYLVEEVLNKQPEGVCTFLLQTAILDQLNDSLCNSLTQRTDGQEMLERLEHSNLFIIPLDNKRYWYRYHHFFIDLLRNRLQHSQPEIIPNLHHRASKWFKENGFLQNAFEHAISGQHYEEAAEIIKAEGNSMLATGAWGQLLTWLQALPEKTIQSRPALGLFYIWGKVLSSQLEGVEKRLVDIEKSLGEYKKETQENKNFYWQLQATRSRIAYLSGDFRLAIEIATRAIDSIDEDDLTIRGIMGITLGSSYFLEGDLTEASRILIEAQRINRQAGNLMFAIDAAGSLAQIQESQGFLNQAAEIYREIIRLSGDNIDPNMMSAHLNLGNVLYEWNDLERAEQNFHTCLLISQKLHALDGRLYATLGLAKTSQAKGDHKKASELIKQCEQQLPNFSNSILGQHASALLAYLALGRGDWQAVEIWAAERHLPADENLVPNLFMKKNEYLILERLLILKNRADDAELFLKKLYGAAETAGLYGFLIEIETILALAQMKLGNQSAGLQIFKRALQQAVTEGYIRIFSDLGEPIIELLQGAEHTDEYREYAHRILAVMDISSKDTSIPELKLVESLTEREMEVLRLLVLGKTNKEIAKDLFLAPGTVKKHLNNIYGKLGVSNRTECARLAYEMKLF